MEKDTEEYRIRCIRRRVYLATLLLVALVNCSLIFSNTYRVITPMLRVFNYMVGVYGVGLLGYCTFWFWRSRRYEKSRALEAFRDPLTGLLNWQGLSHELAEAESAGEGVGLVYVDMLGLERVNAEHGQPAGDVLLQGVAGLLQAKVPEGCAVGRIGGDEFLMIGRGLPQEQLQGLADDIAAAVGGGDFETPLLGKVSNVSAWVRVLPSVPPGRSLLQAIAAVRMLPGGSADSVAGAEQARISCIAVPHVTLGACVCYLWDELDVSVRNDFKAWRQAAKGEMLDRIANDLMELVFLRADVRPFDFVTSPPHDSAVGGVDSAQLLAKKVGQLMGVPYRQVLMPAAFSSVVGHTEPRVGASVKQGSHVLLVDDVIGADMSLRRCVRALSAAGAVVQVVGWAAEGIAHQDRP